MVREALDQNAPCRHVIARRGRRGTARQAAGYRVLGINWANAPGKPPARLRGGLRGRLLWSRRRIPFASACPLPPVRAPCRGVVRSSGLRDSGAPLGDAECAVCMPAGGVEWHNIFRHLRICRLPCHSLSPNARSVCHSVASSGTPMRQHSSGVIEEGSSIGLEHEGQGHPAYP